MNNEKLFKIVEPRYKLNAHLFTTMRENIPLSVEQFAAVIGWSVSYQYQLEEGKYITVSEKVAKEICSAFARYGIGVKLI